MYVTESRGCTYLRIRRNIVEQYQQRVVEEKEQLDERSIKLSDFFITDLYINLSEVEQDRFVSQYKVMQEYSRILGERIAAF